MNRLFDRAVAVTLSRPLERQFFGANTLVTKVTDLRVTFQIEKTLSEDPNTCEVVIYNLNEQTRGELEKKPLHVRLDAGYDGALERLFVGDARFGQSRHIGVNWESKLQLGDGDRAFRHARVNRSFKAGVDVKTALAEVTKSMGLKVPTSVAGAKELVTQFASGVVLQGPSERELSRLLKPRGFSWSIQDGSLQVIRGDGKRRDAEEAAVISQDTGMIGTPEFGLPEKKSGKPVLTVTMLLYPGLQPGGLIKMDARTIRGIFRLDRVQHSGDTHGPDWQTKIEARQL